MINILFDPLSEPWSMVQEQGITWSHEAIPNSRFVHGAAFEAVSKTTLKPIGDDRSAFDLRSVRLPSSSPVNDDNFEPRDHRNPKSPISSVMAYFNVIRSLFGAGMLAMPLAVSQAGIVIGPLLIVFAALLIVHMHLTLLDCLNEISRQLRVPHISYRYGFRIALLHGPPIFRCMGNCGPALIAVFMVLSQLGICTVFVLFTSDSLRDIMDWQSSQPALLALLLPYIIMEFFMKTLKIVSYVSLFGNLMNLAGLSIVFYHIFQDPQGEVMAVAATNIFPMMFAFGTILFNLSALGVILAIDRALPNPKVLTKKCGVVTVGIFVPTVVSVILGSLGYWSFGAMEENVLRSLPFDDPTSMVAMGLYLVAVALAFPIQCTPAIQIILDVIKNCRPESMPSENTLKIVEYIIRPSFVLMAFFVSYLIPFQAPFVAFVGNLCTTILALVFPAIMEVSLLYPSHFGKYNIYLYKNIVIIIIGLSSWTFGVIICIYMMYIRLLAWSSPNDKGN